MIDRYIFGGDQISIHALTQSATMQAVVLHKIFFISNYEDGLINLCKQIQIKLECSLIMCAMSNNLTYPKYMFYYLNQSENERLIQVYKEDKWIFYEKGYALPFENVNFYKK